MCFHVICSGLENDFVHIAQSYKASHQCGLADVFLSYLLERMSSYSLYSGEAFLQCAQVCELSRYLL